MPPASLSRVGASRRMRRAETRAVAAPAREGRRPSFGAIEVRAPSRSGRTYHMPMELGRIGVWTTYRAIGEENAGAAARLVEELGYGAFWLGGSPRLSSVRPLLEATESLVVATGIVNVWAYDPDALAAEH